MKKGTIRLRVLSLEEKEDTPNICYINKKKLSKTAQAVVMPKNLKFKCNIPAFQ